MVHLSQARLGFIPALILVSSLLLSQPTRLNLDHISIGDGLSQATVNDVIKDHQGLIWISTDEGVNRYDGYHFKVYRRTKDDSSLSSNYTENLYLDKNDNLWVCTSDGICKYNRKEDNFTRYYGASSRDQSSNFDVSDIVEDDQGALWIATLAEDHYLLRYDEEEDRFIPQLEASIQEPLRRITTFDKDHLLISFASKSLYLFNTHTYEYQKLPQMLPFPALALARAPDNTIWIGTDDGGLHALRDAGQELQSFRHDPANERSISSNVIWDIEIRPDGDLWLATDKGLNLFATDSFTAKSYQYDPNNPNSIASNFLFSVYEEGDGRIWVGTSEAGISLVHPSRKAFEHFHNQLGLGQSLSNNAIWAIEKDALGEVWIGTSEGLNKLDLNDYSIERIFHDSDNQASLSHNRVWAIRYDPFEDCLRLGTYFGLNRKDRTADGQYKFTSWQLDEADTTTLSSNSIRCLWVDEGGIWAGTTADGLNYFDKRTERSIRYQYSEQHTTSLSDNRVRTLYKDSKGRLWVGTTKGLNLMLGDTFKRFYHLPNDPNTLSNNHIRTIREGAENTFWIGTDYGLNKMEYLADGSASFTAYTVENGLPNNRIYGVEMEGEQVWASTNNGIAKFDPKEERFINFFAVDGLQSNEFNQGASSMDQEGFIYFGGINGLSRFLPPNIAAQDVRQDIVFTNFKVHFEEVEITPDGPLRANIITSPNIILKPDERVFSIEFNALNFNKQVKNRYAYRLMPFEDKWNFADQLNQAVYTNVPPGKYRFEVKTSTYGASAPDEVNHLLIHVNHAFWETWWFRILSVLGLLGIFFSIYQYRLRSLLRSQQVLENKVKERTQVIEQQNKS